MGHPNLPKKVCYFQSSAFLHGAKTSTSFAHCLLSRSVPLSVPPSSAPRPPENLYVPLQAGRQAGSDRSRRVERQRYQLLICCSLSARPPSSLSPSLSHSLTQTPAIIYALFLSASLSLFPSFPLAVSLVWQWQSRLFCRARVGTGAAERSRQCSGPLPPTRTCGDVASVLMHVELE